MSDPKPIRITEARLEGSRDGVHFEAIGGELPSSMRASGDERSIAGSDKHFDRISAARRDRKKRLKHGLVTDDLRFILDDSEIPEDLRFEVFLFEMIASRRQAPGDVLFSRRPKGRQLLRTLGIRVVPPSERQAWDRWEREGGVRPDGKPESRDDGEEE